MRQLHSPITRRRIPTGIDTMISLTCSLALCRHDCYGNQRNRRRNASEFFSWRISRYFNFRASLVFMQDGASAHTSKMAMEWLKDRFPEKLISLKYEDLGDVLNIGTGHHPNFHISNVWMIPTSPQQQPLGIVHPKQLIILTEKNLRQPISSPLWEETGWDKYCPELLYPRLVVRYELLQ